MPLLFTSMLVHQNVRMANLLAIWAVCLLCVTSHGTWDTTEVQQVFIPKNDSHDPIPCVGLQPDERPSLLYWFIGETWEKAKNSLVLRYSDPGVGQNLTVNVRFSISHDFGLIVGKVDTTDSGRYWCRFIRAGTGNEIIEAVDVTVLVRDLLPGPIIWWEPSGKAVSKVDVTKHRILNCSVNDVYPSPDLTLSFLGCRDSANQPMKLFTSNQQSTYDIFSKTYHVTKRAYLGALAVKSDDNCEFECVAKGLAISNGSSSTVVELFATAQQPGNDGPGTKSPSITFIAAFIILAFILIICFVALAYFMYRVYLPRRPNGKKEKKEPSPTGTPDENTGLLMDIDMKNMDDIKADGNTQWSSRGNLKDYKDVLKKDSETIGDIQEVIGDRQGLLLATQKLVIRYPNKKSSQPRNVSEKKFTTDVTSIVKHPRNGTLILGLKNSKLMYTDMDLGNSDACAELKSFTSPKVTVDGAGAIFVGDLNSKTIHMFDSHSKVITEYKLDIDKLRNIAAYGWKHLFVSNGKDTINKYNFRKKDGCLDMFKVKDCINIKPAKDKGLGEMVVHNDRLYVVNDVRIFAYDVEVLEMLHVFETGFQNLQGLCFFGKYMTDVALYSNDRVKIYEIEKAKEEARESSTACEIKHRKV